MEWPTKGPAFKSTENLWGMLAHQVHANAKQFSTLQELRAQIVFEWSEIGQKLAKTYHAYF